MDPTLGTPSERTGARSRVSALVRATHPAPSLAVTCVVALLAVGQGLPAARGVDVTGAVLSGQLTIGWGNDLLDAGRDRLARRREKPLVSGEVSPDLVRRCLAAAAVACVVLSFAVGWRSALVHLCLGVACGHLYNLLLKSTPWSWLPYAVAFGSLPAVVELAGLPPHWPPVWTWGAAAALGVAAHFLNTLPDVEADAATGVRGLPQRIGPVPSRLVASALLVAASGVVLLGPASLPTPWTAAALLLVAGLAAVACAGRGRTPFHAAMAIALVDVVLLVAVPS